MRSLKVVFLEILWIGRFVKIFYFLYEVVFFFRGLAGSNYEKWKYGWKKYILYKIGSWRLLIRNVYVYKKEKRKSKGTLKLLVNYWNNLF